MLTARMWITIGMAVAVAGLLGWSRWQVMSIRADLAESRAETATVRAALDVQTAAVATWRREAEQRAAKAAEALANASAQRRRADGLAATLYGLQLPPGECDALVTLVDTARAGSL